MSFPNAAFSAVCWTRPRQSTVFHPAIKVAVAIAVCAVASSSLAADWSAKTSLSETFEANDNFFMTAAPKGNLYGSTSALFVDMSARTPTAQYTLSGDVGYIHYMGPGAADTSLTSIIQNGVSLTAEYAGHQPGDKLDFVTSWRRQDIATAQINDIGIATAQGEISTVLFGSNFSKQLSAVDTLTFAAAATIVEPTAGSGTPYRNLTVGPVWTRTLNSITDWVSLTDLSWTAWDDSSKSDTKFTRAMTGFRLRPTSRLKVSASVGFGVVNGTGGNPTAGIFGPPVVGLGIQQGQGSVFVGYLADGQATYQLSNTTDLTVTASRAITPGVLGDLSLRTSYGAGIIHRINSSSSISVKGELTKTSTFGGDEDFWTAGAAYEKRLSREWRTNLSYSYRQRMSSLQSVSSNSFVFVLARDVTLLP